MALPDHLRLLHLDHHWMRPGSRVLWVCPAIEWYSFLYAIEAERAVMNSPLQPSPNQACQIVNLEVNVVWWRRNGMIAKIDRSIYSALA